VPTLRDVDGLALSSRNVYLDARQRAAAPSLHRALQAVAQAISWGESDVGRALEAGRPVIEPPLELEYLAVVDPLTFLPLERAAPGALVVGTVRAGTTRLLDNEPVLARVEAVR
jgi:pantoate--beta-alanine ligase